MESKFMHPQPMEDLVASAQEGDQKSFEALVAGLNTRLGTLLQARIGPHLRGRLEVDDALQETLLRAFKSIERFQWHGEDSLFRWLASIAERVILESARQDQTQRTLELKRDPVSRDPSPSKSLRRKERFDRLEKALSCLSPEQRGTCQRL